METREEIVSKLELIRENILGFIQARSRQVTLVNQMRTAKLIQQDEYNDNTIPQACFFNHGIFKYFDTIRGFIVCHLTWCCESINR